MNGGAFSSSNTGMLHKFDEFVENLLDSWSREDLSINSYNFSNGIWNLWMDLWKISIHLAHLENRHMAILIGKSLNSVPDIF